MSEKLKIGFAGCRFGRRHIEAFSKLDNAELAAIADPNEEIRKELANTFNIETEFQDFDALVASASIDAVVIATPTGQHAEQICAAFDAGLHVLCEQPPATTESEMSKIASSAGFTGKTFMWARHQRFSPELQEARELFEQGALGNVYHATARWRWGFWPFAADDWRGDSEQKGGALLEMGVDAIDSAWFAMGCPDPVEAFASHHNHFLKGIASDPDAAAEDSSFGIVRFKNGATLSYEVAFFSHTAGETNPWQSPEMRQLELWGSKASLDIENGRLTQIEGKSAAQRQYASLDSPQEEWFHAQAREFADAIAEERQPLNSAKQGQALVKMIDALARSAKEQKAVSIRTIRDLDELFGGV